MQPTDEGQMNCKHLKLHQKLAKVGASFGLAAMSILLATSAFANVTGTSRENFNTTGSAKDFVTVYSSKTLGQGNLSLGLFMNYAVNTLPYFQDETTGDSNSDAGSRSKFNDSLLSTEASVAFGLIDKLDIFAAVPAVIYQNVGEDSRTHGSYDKRGVTEFRAGAKYQLWTDEMFGVAAVGSTNINTTKGDPYAGDRPMPTYNLELVGDVDLGFVAFAANVGYRWKTPGNQEDDNSKFVEPVRNQYVGSLAASYPIPGLEKTSLVAEVYGSAPTAGTDDASSRKGTTAESLLGAKINGKGGRFYHFGAGTELQHSVASPDWRLYAGIQWVVGTKSKEAPAPEVVAAPVEEKPDEVFVVHDIFFEFASAKIRASDGDIDQYFSSLVNSLSNKPFTQLVIEGHTCAIGSDGYNIGLSQKRANMIRDILVKKYKIDPSKIVANGLGESRPIAPNNTEAGREQNRRVEFKVFRDQDKNLNAQAAAEVEVPKAEKEPTDVAE